MDMCLFDMKKMSRGYLQQDMFHIGVNELPENKDWIYALLVAKPMFTLTFIWDRNLFGMK